MKITTTLPHPPLALDRVPGDPTFSIGMLSTEVESLLGRDGRLHGCVTCLGSTMHHFSPAGLYAAGDPRLPAQWAEIDDCGLHPRCAPRLIVEWAMIIHGAAEFGDDEVVETQWRREAATRENASGARRAGAYGRRNTD